MRINWIFLMCLFFFASCKEQTDEDIVTEIPPVSKRTLVNWSTMNDLGWKNLSFPLWFSPEKIDSHGISALEMSFSSYYTFDTIVSITDTLPDKILNFNFNKNGTVEKIILKEYDTGIQIEENTVNYIHKADSFGYSLPNITTKTSYRQDKLTAWLGALQDLQQYERLELQQTDSLFLKYIDRNDINQKEHYFILDDAYWNVSFIDRNIQSKNDKIFYYGSPKTFLSSFSIANLVEKTKREDRSYYENGVLSRQSFYTQDFITKRSFNYDANGVCIGFSDSLTTSSQQFIHLTKAVITYTQSLPKEVLFYNEEDTAQEHPIRLIRFKFQ